MKSNINKKIMATLLLIIILVSDLIGIFPLLESKATNIGDTIYLDSIGVVDYHLKSHSLPNRWLCNY